MTDSRHKIAVALFVRHPVPGNVKTRLARDLGDEAACDLYRNMVIDTITNIKACGLPLYLFHDGQDADRLPSEWVGVADAVISQSGDSLGERMITAHEFLFSIGLERILLAGSDIPGIDAALLRSAIAAIEENDVVFSPALDGGYCLVATKKERFHCSIFREIPWSTCRVIEATLDRCKADGLSYTLLEPRQDIDTLNDIESYCKQPSPPAIATNSWLVEHGYLMPSLTVW